MRTRIVGTNGEGVIVAEMVSQAPLVSGTNIKTVSGNSLLGSGDLQLDVNDIDGLGTAASADVSAFDAAGSAATVLSALAAHDVDTTSVHGIADTSTLYRAGGTDVTVADGGTGASDAAGARTNLGLVIGSHVQGFDATLSALAAWDWSSGVEVATMTADDTLAILRVGTAANNLLQLDGSGKIPAVDGSQLTNLPGGAVRTVLASPYTIVSASTNTTILTLSLPVGVHYLSYSLSFVHTVNTTWTPRIISGTAVLGGVTGDASGHGFGGNGLAQANLTKGSPDVFTLRGAASALNLSVSGHGVLINVTTAGTIEFQVSANQAGTVVRAGSVIFAEALS